MLLGWTVLYYHLPDPTGTSLLLVDTDGISAGYVLYDGYGQALTSTLAPELKAALAGQGATPDPDTGLVYPSGWASGRSLGDGRWYPSAALRTGDPALGRPLQPNPTGGPPTVPQALNRYAATPWGAPGVAEGIASNSFALAIRNQIPGAVAGLAVNQVTITSVERQIVKRAVPTAWGLVELVHPPTTGLAGLVTRFTQSGLGQSLVGLPWVGSRLAAYYASRNVRSVQRALLEEAMEGSFAAGEGVAVGQGSIRLLAREVTYVDEVVERTVVRGLGKGVSLGLTSVASGVFSFGFQYLSDSSNPYLTGEQKLRRAGISGVVGSGAAFIGFMIGGPVGFVVGLGLGVAGDLWLAPMVFQSLGVVPRRNLAPFLP